MAKDETSHGQEKRPVTILRREPGWRAGLSAMFGGVCPRCRREKIFTGLFSMPAECGLCGLRFEREPGYFTGAMYVSYLIALPIFIGIFLLLQWYFAWSFWPSLAGTVVLFVPFVPFVFRVSRILWIHFDRAVDAED